MTSAIGVALSVVGKALSPVADGLLEAWAASKDLRSNFEELRRELLCVKALLETAQGKQLDGEAQKELLNTLRHSASKAEDILDELDYFRIHDKLHGTSDAADEHPKGGCAHNLVFNLCHTAKAVSNRLAPSCAAGYGGSSSSSTTNTNLAVDKGSGCMPNLGKLFLCSSSPTVQADDVVDSRNSMLNATEMHKATRKKPIKLGFDRVDISSRMKETIKELQTIQKKFSKVVQNSNPRIPTNIARPTTISESIEPKLYGRAREVEGIIHDITEGKYCEENLTVLPIVGPGGIGKTTMTQHIHHNQDVQKHFDVVIWVCVSQNFNLNKLLEEIKGSIPRVDLEKGEGSAKELIEQRLKSKRFLLILDDMWERIDEDVWKNLLLPLKKSEEKGSIILVTTRFQSLAQMVKTTENPTVLEGIKHEEFKELFLAYVFGDYQSGKHNTELLAIGEKIMEKLKGSPLAAKTVGRLLRNNLNLRQWEKVLESKEWETQNEVSDIMPALRLSYDYLPFQLQQCFFYCGLFPEDYKFDSKELIWFWIGLGILHAGPDFEEIGMSSLNGLVTHGFLKKEETNGHVHYIMHDLLHDLALMVSSHECLSVHGSVRSVGIQPCIRHLSIITDGVDCELFKNDLIKLKDTLKVEDLQTLMFFGSIGNSFADIFVDLFSEAKSFRVVRLPKVPDSVQSMVPKFSELLHLRYLSLGTDYDIRLHIPDCISRFYHLRILDLKGWEGCRDLPRDITNLGKLCHFLGPRENLNSPTDNLHSSICDVGKLKLLRELKAFIVNKEDQGYEPEQLGHLTELTELRIYYLEKIHEKEEAAKAKLLEKRYLERLALVWYSDGENTITDRPERHEKVLESLQPHRHLQHLYIGGHRGRSCPTWLGDELAVRTLNHLHLSCVSWEVTPSLGQMPDLRELIFEYMAGIVEFGLEQTFSMLTRLELVRLERLKKWVAEGSHLFGHLQELIIKDCPALLELPFSDQQNSNKHRFPLLQKLEIVNCPEVLSLPPIPWTETLCSVLIKNSKLLCKLILSECTLELITSGRRVVDSLDKILVFENLGELESLTLVILNDICPPYCPPLNWKHLQLLKSLKKFIGEVSFGTTVVPTGGQGDVQWQLPIEDINMIYSGASGEEMTWLLQHLPKLSQLKIEEHITQLVFQQTITPVPEEVEAVESVTKKGKEEEKGGPLVLPAHLSNSLEKLEISAWKLSKSMWLVIYPLHELQTLRILHVEGASRCKLAGFSSWCYPFPSSLQDLKLDGVLGFENLEPLSNLSSLSKLKIFSCGEHLRCDGLAHLLTRGQLSELEVGRSPRDVLDPHKSPKFFVRWDPRQELHLENGDEQPSSKLRILKTEGITGVLTAPICSFLASSLAHLFFYGEADADYFTEEQQKALQLLTSLEELYFSGCRRFPQGLNKLTKLKKLEISHCRFMESMPIDGLPGSLRELDVKRCYSAKLKRQCSELKGTIPILRLEDSLNGIYFGNKKNSSAT